MSQFWPSCISGTSHAPCWEVPSALLPVCSAVSPPYKNFSCSPSFFSSFLFFFLPCLSSCTSIQVSSLKPSQVKVTESVRLKFCSAIALSQQEPWKSSHQESSISTTFSAFYPLQSQELGRTLVLVNRRILRSSISLIFWSKDLVSLEIRVQTKLFWIHNLYFTPTSQRNYRESAQTLPYLLEQAIQKEGEHILLTDSNLHHPSWSKSSQLYSELALSFKDLTDK